MAGFSRRKVDFFRTFLSVIAVAGGTVAPILPAADYYVSKSHVAAVDSPSSGGVNQPYKTWNYAITQVSAVATAASPKTLYVVPEEYVSTAKVNVGKGVKAFGAGITSKITAAYQGDDGFGRWLSMVDADLTGRSAIVDGNNEFSYLFFDGNALTCWNAGYARGRSNVKVHHCRFQDFNHSGLTISGFGNDPLDYSPPDVYATGIEFTYNTLINSSWYSNPIGWGSLQIGALDGAIIEYNIFDNSARAQNQNGYCIKYYRGSYLKNTQINYNKITRLPVDNGTFPIIVEIWYSLGNNTFSYNETNGTLDLVQPTKGAYAFSWDVHHNLFTADVVSTRGDSAGVTIESDPNQFTGAVTIASHILVHHNYFANRPYSIILYPSGGCKISFVDVWANIFFQSGGYSSKNTAAGFRDTTSIEDINWIGNTYIVNKKITNINQIVVNTQVKRFNFIDNIVDGGNGNYWLFWGEEPLALVDVFNIDSNYISDCGSNNVGYQTSAAAQVTNLTETNNTKTSTPLAWTITPNQYNPSINNYRPATKINGVSHPLNTIDYLGVVRAATPCMGAIDV